MMWFGWGFPFMGICFLVAIAVGIYLLVTSFSRGSGHAHYQPFSYRSERALEILKERYAKGEIYKEQFLKMRKELES